MIRIPRWFVLSLAVVFMAPAGVRAQKGGGQFQHAAPEKADAEGLMVIKVYQVLDLVTRVADYPYEGSYLPALRNRRTDRIFFPFEEPAPGGGMGAGMGGGGGMGGMGGGMGGSGMGGGMFQVAAEPAAAAPSAGGTGGGMEGMSSRGTANSLVGARRVGVMQLIAAIKNIVEPASWTTGDAGSIEEIGGALAIRQTAAVHAQVKDLLEQLRHEGGTFRSLTIAAEWLLLSRDQLAELKMPADPKKPSAHGRSLNRQALGKLPATARRHTGQITCFNGQTVYIVSGRMETSIQGAIPVVGQIPAYQAILLTPQMGALLQATPSMLPGDEGVLLDLRSSVTRGDEPGKPVKLPGWANSDAKDQPAVQIDRLNVAAQQFATTVRMPLGEPVLVGGMTFPGREPGSPDEQLYLVVEVEAAH
jgi:hypothetical protein